MATARSRIPTRPKPSLLVEPPSTAVCREQPPSSATSPVAAARTRARTATRRGGVAADIAERLLEHPIGGGADGHRERRRQFPAAVTVTASPAAERGDEVVGR